MMSNFTYNPLKEQYPDTAHGPQFESLTGLNIHCTRYMRKDTYKTKNTSELCQHVTSQEDIARDMIRKGDGVIKGCLIASVWIVM